MLTRANWMLGLFLVVVAIACNKHDFKGSNDSPSPQNHLVKINGIDSYDAGSKSVRSFDTIDFVIQASAPRNSSDSTTTTFPVDLYLVVDNTASMNNEIEEIRLGLKSLVSGLKTEGVDLWAGFVGFVDDNASIESRTFAMTGDINALQSYIDGVKLAESNGDYPEASIRAATRAAERFKNGEGRPGAMKMMLLITDVVGHNGTGSLNNRDCSLEPAISQFEALAASLGSTERFKFFYLVPDGSVTYPDENDNRGARETCAVQNGVSMNIKAQMENLMSRMLTGVPADRRGGPLLDASGHLAWPMRNNNFVTTLKPLIVQHKPVQSQLQCVASSAELVDKGNVIYKWHADDIRRMTSVQNNEILFDDAIKNQRPEGTQALELKIERCCLQDTTSTVCKSTYTQVVKYSVVNNK